MHTIDGPELSNVIIYKLSEEKIFTYILQIELCLEEGIVIN